MRNIKPSINDVERPSPREIETLCAAIRAKWTEQQEYERRRSLYGDEADWAVPQFLVHHSESPRWGKGRTIVYRRID